MPELKKYMPRNLELLHVLCRSKTMYFTAYLEAALQPYIPSQTLMHLTASITLDGKTLIGFILTPDNNFRFFTINKQAYLNNFACSRDPGKFIAVLDRLAVDILQNSVRVSSYRQLHDVLNTAFAEYNQISTEKVLLFRKAKDPKNICAVLERMFARDCYVFLKSTKPTFVFRDIIYQLILKWKSFLAFRTFEK